jgi:hypothetical protein
MLAQAPRRLHRTNVSDWKRPASIKPRTLPPQPNGFQPSLVRLVRKARYPALKGCPSTRRLSACWDSTWSTMPLRLRHTKRLTPRSTDRYIPVPTRLMGWLVGAREPSLKPRIRTFGTSVSAGTGGGGEPRGGPARPELAAAITVEVSSTSASRLTASDRDPTRRSIAYHYVLAPRPSRPAIPRAGSHRPSHPPGTSAASPSWLLTPPTAADFLKPDIAEVTRRQGAGPATRWPPAPPIRQTRDCSRFVRAGSTMSAKKTR